ncbi:MAG: NAD-dependent epimerase/dehydratase family protein [SAR202 cluster bacterium]|nr:NAD-dependent epimerase/dehydratase family protein [SAR202 cluster bacterium]|tara:strand:- start:374 stop:1363 length:990 start_codon:yes stop_codon:yes gene_type:complete
MSNVLVTGGAGYVGSVLVPKLLAQGHHVKVLDLFMYGEDTLDAVKGNPNLELIKGDIRDRKLLDKSIPGSDAVIHLACISNDPSFELNPELGKSINYDAFFDLVDVSKDSGVRRFVYASSSSVYGIIEDREVTEDLELKPLTDYSKYKAMCEDVLLAKKEPGFIPLILRPATVCGYSPRLRLDLIVNILTNHAVNNKQIRVFGGEQKRPNIHIDDVTDLYVNSLIWPEEVIDCNIFNAGYDNQTVNELAKSVQVSVGEDVEIVTTPTDDLRSYHISSEKIEKALGYVPQKSTQEAVEDLVAAFGVGKIPHSMDDIRYYNIKQMQAMDLK